MLAKDISRTGKSDREVAQAIAERILGRSDWTTGTQKIFFRVRN